MDTSAADSPNMRVGDAERAEVADLLARHFSDGRLDQAELDERLDQTMHARTRADLLAVLADLPATPAAGFAPPPPAQVPQPAAPPRRRTLSPLPGLILVVALVLLLGHGDFWLLAAALACLVLISRRRRKA
jgi:Domain of unknown function (DUF1707)